jgi:hypothetical protein
LAWEGEVRFPQLARRYPSSSKKFDANPRLSLSQYPHLSSSGLRRALHYGAPPHGGLAPGIDRIVMLIANQPNLREVTAFPLNQQAEELLLGAPSPVDEKQLKELHIQLSLAARERLREERDRAGPAAALDHLVSPHAG